jgi:hypothetical protein
MKKDNCSGLPQHDIDGMQTVVPVFWLFFNYVKVVQNCTKC